MSRVGMIDHRFQNKNESLKKKKKEKRKKKKEKKKTKEGDITNYNHFLQI